MTRGMPTFRLRTSCVSPITACTRTTSRHIPLSQVGGHRDRDGCEAQEDECDQGTCHQMFFDHACIVARPAEQSR